MYTYNTAEEAILSLERAYTNEDMHAILMSKDFKTEALLILERSSKNFNLNDEELIFETSELLKLGLIESIAENGFPNFANLEIEFSEIEHCRDNLYVLYERIIYPDGDFTVNKIYVTNDDNFWKVAMIDESA